MLIEAFADRNYTRDLRLVSRENKNALIEEPKEVLEHILRMVKLGNVLTVEHLYRPMKADTFCVHGDTPSALKILMYLQQELPTHNIQIK